MFTYFKMKKNERKIKAALYGTIGALMDNQKDIMALIQKLFEALKDVSAEDMKDEFISRLAELIHEDADSHA